TRQGRQQDPIGRFQLGLANSALEHRELVPKDQQFNIFCRIAQEPEACQLQRPARQQIDP
ncbi:hypothetical protein ACWGQ5_51900, partial [Streptomyces sp. NPDC055722]